MKKTMKYETPEIEITRFEVETKIMEGYLPIGPDNDREDPTPDIGNDDWISIPDLELPL